MNVPARSELFRQVDREGFYRFVETVEDYERYEWVRGWIVQQQQGGTLRHGLLEARFASLLRTRLDGSAYVVVTGRGVETPKSTRYADVVVEPADEDPSSLAARRPVLIVEILSPSSGDRDRIEKPEEYLSLGTLAAYIVADQFTRTCLAWVRGADGQFARDPARFGHGETIGIEGLSLTLSLNDIYSGIVDPPQGTENG